MNTIAEVWRVTSIWRFAAVRRLAAGWPIAAVLVVSCVPGCSFRDGDGVRGADGYSFNFQGEQASRDEKGELPADVTRVEVRHKFGRVQIAPTTERPRWTWEVTCWAETPEQAQRFAETVRLTTGGENGAFHCRLELPEPPSPDLRGVRSTLVLHVPAEVSVDVANAFGDTSIEGVGGGTIAHCRHSKLQLEQLAGTIEAATSHADLIAEHISGAKLTNEHGLVRATRVDGDLEAATSHADLRVESVTGAAQLHNEHGLVSAVKIAGDLHIRTSHAAAEVNDAAGRIEARNEHGPISVSTVRQDVDLETSHAGIELDGIEGRLVARNEHGAITGRRIRGSIDAESSFGTIELDVLSREVACRNEHGAIRLTLRSPELKQVEAETSFGELEVRVASAISPRIEASADHGQVRSDYPVLQIQSGVDNFRNLAAGTARMTLKNEHGNVRVVDAAGSAEQ